MPSSENAAAANLIQRRTRQKTNERKKTAKGNLNDDAVLLILSDEGENYDDNKTFGNLDNLENLPYFEAAKNNSDSSFVAFLKSSGFGVGCSNDTESNNEFTMFHGGEEEDVDAFLEGYYNVRERNKGAIKAPSSENFSDLFGSYEKTHGEVLDQVLDGMKMQ